MSRISGNRGSLNSMVEFGKWRINQKADGTWQGNLELPNDKVGAIAQYKLEPLKAEFCKSDDTYKGLITVERVKRGSSSSIATVQFKGNSNKSKLEKIM